MYYFKMGVGFVMCIVGGLQLAAVLNEGEGGAEASSASSYRWAARCNDIARRGFGSAPHSHIDIDRGMMSLRQSGCDPSAAPSGVIPMVSDDATTGGSNDDEANDWGNGNDDWRMRSDGWGD